MDFAQPPPSMMGAPPTHMPPPNLSMPPPMGHMNQGYQKFEQRGGFMNNRPPFRPFLNLQRPLPGPLGNMTLEDFDGKRLRKSVMRKTVDYNSAIIKAVENRVWQRDYRDRRALQPDVMYYPDMMPPPSYPDNPINCVTTRFVKTATNKMRCPIFCMAWTPEGRRLVTGASSGEFTLWNGLTFNFETILQAHDSPVRTMVWSHNDSWMVTGDHAGYVKYWQSNMNNVKMFQAHKEALRGISFSPSDNKFVTCSDDGTLRVWDFFRYQEERVLRGHGADVKCVHWHPQKGLVVSGSKDNQQPIKLWDPKTGQSLATLHAHKSTVMDLKWNENGNWLITASRDHLLKLFDLRNLSQEVQTFRGHKKEASSVAWHPCHEGLFCSGGSDGSIMFWHVGADKEVGAIEQAHDSIVWTLAWHPLGHILCSGSNDHTSKFWTRNRPGDLMRDKYNLNTLPAGIAGLEDMDVGAAGANDEGSSIIPGMGPDDKVDLTLTPDGDMAIPGLDLDLFGPAADDKSKAKKVPYSKPIPRNFQAQWNETAGNDDTAGAINEVISQIVENTPGVVPLQKIAPNAIIVYGKYIPVHPGSKLETAIAEGPEALEKYLKSGEIEELQDVMPIEEQDYLNDAYTDEDNEETNTNNSNNSFRPPLNIPQNLHGQGHTLNLDESRFKPGADQDMRKNFGRDMGDVDLRNSHNQDTDYRTNRDYDMRQLNTDMADEDFRMPYSRDQDFRGNNHFEENEEENEQFEEDYGNNYQDSRQDSREWHGRGNNGNFNQRNQNFGQNNGPNFQNFRNNQGQNFGQFRPQQEEFWGNNGENNFRGGRGMRRGGPRGMPRGRGNLRGNRGGPGPRGQPPRGGGPARGGPRGRNKF